jgi:hypothetical protein
MATGDRIVEVPKSALMSLARAKITPPPAGKLDVKDVDSKLTAAGMDIEERMVIKGTLRRCGLL